MNNRNVAKLTVICWYETIKMIWFKGTSALEMTLTTVFLKQTVPASA